MARLAARNAAGPHPDSTRSSIVAQALPSAAEAAPDACFSSLIGTPQ